MVMRVTMNNVNYTSAGNGGITLIGDGGQAPGETPTPPTWSQGSESASISFWLLVEAANEAALKTAVDGIIANATSTNMLNPVIVDNGGSGSVVFSLAVGVSGFVTREGDCQIEVLSETDALIRVTQTFSRPSPTGASGGDPDPLTNIGVSAQCDRGPGGYLTVTLRAPFTNDGATTAMSAALAWIGTIVNRSTAITYLPWLPAVTALRVIGSGIDDSENLYSTASSSNNRATAYVIMQELDPGLVLANLDAAIRDCQISIAMAPMPLPTDIAKQWRGNVVGIMQFKVAGNTSFDSGDSAPGWPSVSAIKSACAAILTLAKTRGNMTGGTNVIEESVDLDATQGRIIYRADVISGGNYVTFSSQLTVDNESNLVVLNTGAKAGGRGRPFVYTSGLPVIIYTHTLTISTIGAEPVYRRPGVITDAALQLHYSESSVEPVTMPAITDEGSNKTVYVQSYRVVWRDIEARGADGSSEGGQGSGTWGNGGRI